MITGHIKGSKIFLGLSKNKQMASFCTTGNWRKALIWSYVEDPLIKEELANYPVKSQIAVTLAVSGSNSYVVGLQLPGGKIIGDYGGLEVK